MPAPTHQEQEAEAAERKATGADPAITAAAIDVPNDGARGSPGDPPGSPRIDPPPAERQPPPPYVQKRDEIVARWRTDRTTEADAERESLDDFARSGMPPEFQQFEPAADPDPAATPPPTPAPGPGPQMVKVKVHGVEKELPLEELVSKAQIALASENILDEVKALKRDWSERVRTDTAARPGPSGHQAGEQRTLAEPAPTEGEEPPPEDAYAKLMEAMQFGDDPQAARALLQKTIADEASKVVPQIMDTARLQDEGARAYKILQDFKKENPELAEDPYAEAVMHRRVYDLQVEDLRSIGVDPSSIETPDGVVTPAHIARAHSWYRSKGLALKTPETMLENARDHVLAWRGVKKSPAEPAPAPTRELAPRVEINVDRTVRRQAIPQNPTRTAPPRLPTLEAPAQRRDPSDVVQQELLRRNRPRGRVTA